MDDESLRVHKDELCTVIKDKYPKVGRRPVKLEKISFEYHLNELNESTVWCIVLPRLEFTC